MDEERLSHVETDVAGSQINQRELSNSWEQYLVNQTDSLSTLSSVTDTDKERFEPPTESNQRIPQIRALLQSLKQAQGRRVLEIGFKGTIYHAQMFLDSFKSNDRYDESLTVLKHRVQGDNHLACLNVLKEQAEALYLSRRASFNMHFRGFARELNIHDIPDGTYQKLSSKLFQTPVHQLWHSWLLCTWLFV